MGQELTTPAQRNERKVPGALVAPEITERLKPFLGCFGQERSDIVCTSAVPKSLADLLMDMVSLTRSP